VDRIALNSSLQLDVVVRHVAESCEIPKWNGGRSSFGSIVGKFTYDLISAYLLRQKDKPRQTRNVTRVK
jgi:hypothetical protein